MRSVFVCPRMLAKISYKALRLCLSISDPPEPVIEDSSDRTNRRRSLIQPSPPIPVANCSRWESTDYTLSVSHESLRALHTAQPVVDGGSVPVQVIDYAMKYHAYARALRYKVLSLESTQQNQFPKVLTQIAKARGLPESALEALVEVCHHGFVISVRFHAFIYISYYIRHK